MKTILITGATSGIGFETATFLANPETQLILPVRNLEKAEKVKTQILELKPNSQISLIECDFVSLSSVKQAATQIQSKFQYIDTLINNAGVLMDKYEQTQDGFEMTFGVNYLAPFFLTQQLLPMILNNTSGDRRIINISSVANKFGKVDFDNLQKFSSNQYANTKLMINLWTFKLARMYPMISINCLHPGFVKTNISSQHTNPFSTLPMLFKLVFNGGLEKIVNAETGARTTIFLATDPSIKNITSKYFSNCAISEPNKLCFDTDLQDRLWEVTEELVTEKLDLYI